MKTYARIALASLAAFPAGLMASSTDRKIEEDARASYNYRTVLRRQVSIEARNGVVTLTGTVEDKEDKALAADTIEDFSGITRVDNEIVISPTVAEYSDGWIAIKARSRLLVKANVTAATTVINVKDGVVTLTGTTTNAAEKDLTAAVVLGIEHVKSVRNELVAGGSGVAGQGVSEFVDDASITSQVRFALLTDRSTSTIKTTVETKRGVVAVAGEVASDAEKACVTKVTEGVRGVISVLNNMTVKS